MAREYAQIERCEEETVTPKPGERGKLDGLARFWRHVQYPETAIRRLAAALVPASCKRIREIRSPHGKSCKAAHAPSCQVIRVYRLIVRTIAVSYWGGLTLLLLVPSPAALLGMAGIDTPSATFGVHFTAFALLAWCVSAAQWPRSLHVRILMLVSYALATETLQSFVPPRTVQVGDYLENLGGLATGWVAFALANRWWSRRRKQPGQERPSPRASA